MDAKQMSVFVVLVAGLVLTTLSPVSTAPMTDASAQEQIQEQIEESEQQAQSTMRSGGATSMFISTTGSNNETSPDSHSHATGSVKDSLHIINRTSTFTCFGREMGYYADTERDCRIYFFCMAGDYNGELVYQRISYLCLNEDVFDQQALDCVPAAKSTTKCAESGQYFSSSNQVLRSAIASSHYENQHVNSTSAAAAAASAPAPAPVYAETPAPVAAALSGEPALPEPSPPTQ